jgi:hypothetical protein
MPKATRIVNVPTRETGIAMTGMIVARQLSGRFGVRFLLSY